MSILLLSAADVARALPMRDAIAATREAFTALADGLVTAPPRVHLTPDHRPESDQPAAAGGTTLLMAASGPVGRVTKVVNIFPGNRSRGLATTSGMVTLLDPETGHAVGLCDGGMLTAIRTGAVGGLAADLLARPDASVAAVFGAGGQAETQALALAAVRPLRSLRIHSPTPHRREALARRLAEEHGLPAAAAADPAEALRGADLVTAATNSTRPVFDGARLEPGTHVTGIGSFRAAMRELDETTVRRAARVVVDLRSSALHEAGELIAADAAAATRSGDWIELGALLADPGRGRRSPDEVTLFKSVGHAVQDLYAAQRAFERARTLGIGQEITL